MNGHTNLSTDTLYLRGRDNRATLKVQKEFVEDLVNRQGCEVCGVTMADLTRAAAQRGHASPHEILMRVLPCEDTDVFVKEYAKSVDVHVICTRCQVHPLLMPEDTLGVIRCVGALTEADRVMIALWDDSDAR